MTDVPEPPVFGEPAATILGAAPVPLVLLDAVRDQHGQVVDFAYAYLNHAAHAFLDVTGGPAQGERLSAHPPGGSAVDLVAQAASALSDGAGVRVAVAGAPFHYELTAIGENSVMLAWREATLELWQALAETGTNAAFFIGGDGHIALVNEAAVDTFGYSREQLLAMRAEDLLGESGREIHLARRARFLAAPERWLGGQMAQLFARRNGGELFPAEVGFSPARADGRMYTAAVVRDVSERARLRELLRAREDDDSLTGLPSRRRFTHELDRHVRRAGGRAPGGALVLVGLRNLAQVNDTLGRGAGDDTLRALAARLRPMLAASDTLARLGGRFVALLPGADPEEALATARALREAVARPTPEAGGVPLQTAAGVVMVPSDARRATGWELVADAEAAMRAVATDGPAALLGADELRRDQPRRLLDRLNAALAGDGFELYAQPIVGLKGHRGERIFEMLLRLHDGDGTLTPPDVFMPAGARFGLARRIDRFVLAQAVGLLARSPARARLSVNLSAESLSDPTLAEFVKERLAAAGADPGRLIIEVTEHSAVANIPDAAKLMSALARHGCEFALDDFGYGFGSFRYLHALPFDIVKIAPAFLDGEDPDLTIVKAMLQAARSLGKRTVVEGVAHPDALTHLRRWHADYAQGFHVGRPKPAELALGIAART